MSGQDCGGVKGGQFVVLAAKPVDADSPLIFLYMNIPTADDTPAFGEVLNSLAIAGAVASAEESDSRGGAGSPGRRRRGGGAGEIHSTSAAAQAPTTTVSTRSTRTRR